MNSWDTDEIVLEFNITCKFPVHQKVQPETNPKPYSDDISKITIDDNDLCDKKNDGFNFQMNYDFCLQNKQILKIN